MIFSTFGFFVPPTIGTRSINPAGSVQNRVRPTSASPNPNHQTNSVRLGTSETMRAVTPGA